MLRISRNSFYLVSILPFGTSSGYDVDKSKSTEKKNEKNGWDRLHQMFSLDEFGSLSPELTSVMQTTYLGIFAGACYGGFLYSKTAYTDFLDKNDATAFQSHLDAKRKLQDAVTKSFINGAFKWSWRLGVFSGSFVLLTTALSVYRGKTRVSDFFVGGAVLGTLARTHVGLRGMLVGGILGSMLGTFAGGLSITILKLGGMTMEDIRYWQYKWKEEHKGQWREAFKAAEKDPLIEYHNIKVGPEGRTLDAIDSSEASAAKPT